MADFDINTPCPIRSTESSVRSGHVLESISSIIARPHPAPSAQSFARRRLARAPEPVSKFNFSTGQDGGPTPRPAAARRKPLYQAPVRPGSVQVQGPSQRALGTTDTERPTHGLPHLAGSVAQRPIARPTHLQSVLAPRSPNIPSPTRPITLRGKDLDSSAEVLRDEPQMIAKQPRRRTIFVPSDNTTILSIHPGGSPLEKGQSEDAARLRLGKSGHFEILDENLEDATPLGLTIMSPIPGYFGVEAPLVSTLARRRPLQSSRLRNSNTLPPDISIGADLAKENVPPGWIEDQLTLGASCDSNSPAPTEDTPKVRNFPPTPATQSAAQGGSESTPRKRSLPGVQAGSPAKVQRRNSRLLSFSLQSSPAYPKSSSPRASLTPGSYSSPRSVPSSHAPTLKGKPQAQPSWADVSPAARDQLLGPKLYRDHWLGHQEAAIVQLLNALLDLPNTRFALSSRVSQSLLQERAARIWLEKKLELPMKRVEAAMQWGTLALPKSMLSWADRLEKSSVHKKIFLQLWLSSFPVKLLQAALLFVVKRPFPESAVRVPESASASYRNGLIRQTVEDYLIEFLIGNKDAQVKSTNHQSSGSSSSGDEIKVSAWQRTTQRSLQIILILDHLKAAGDIQGNLFRRQSTIKSSADFLVKLAAMLLPMTKQPIRSLSQLGYDLQHEQCEADEYDYEIRNLATDVRDGVRLHRIVCKLGYGAELQKSVELPSLGSLRQSGDRISADRRGADYALTISPKDRHERLSNVTHVLVALSNRSSDVSSSDAPVRAEDIVDGYRERTIDFLWRLIEDHGIPSMVDLQFMHAEIEAHEERVGNNYAPDSSDVKAQETLRRWALAVASSSDLSFAQAASSCFSDTRIYEAIINSYSASYPTKKGTKPLSACTSLHQKLRTLGARSDFAGIFGCPAHSGEAYDSKFVTAALTFLASTLLPHVQRERAARALQRRWRKREMAWEMKRRIVLARLARDCMTVVVTSKRVTDAAIVIQRAWRMALERRIGRLVADVSAFQGLARGFIARSAAMVARR